VGGKIGGGGQDPYTRKCRGCRRIVSVGCSGEPFLKWVVCYDRV
jgi:hypothetical protein